MATAEPTDARIPVICHAPSTVIGANIFNPNSWSNDSKDIVRSCLVKFSVLHHCVDQIVEKCKESEQLCQPQIAALKKQWEAANFDLRKLVLFGEQPNLHMLIEAFFSGVKSFLDLVVQLLSSEKIVTSSIHGFHRSQDVYGGSVLNALRNNAPADRKELAGEIEALLNEHKNKWIDQAIYARDQLIHPKWGMFQLMFQFECTEKDGKLVCMKINPPVINSTPIDQYTQRTLENATSYASAFIALLQGAEISTKGV